MAAKKTYYYLDAGALLEEDFFLIAEQLVNTVPGLCFLLDTAVYREIERSFALGDTRAAYTMQNFVNLFASLGAMQVDTAGGFECAALSPMAAEKLYVVTQQQKLVDTFSALGASVTFLRCHAGQLVPWTRTVNENGKAFYLTRDIYVNPFEIDKLTYVFSPRYGYLKLDKSNTGL